VLPRGDRYGPRLLRRKISPTPSRLVIDGRKNWVLGACVLRYITTKGYDPVMLCLCCSANLLLNFPDAAL
jgi:hypothetical protein